MRLNTGSSGALGAALAAGCAALGLGGPLLPTPTAHGDAQPSVASATPVAPAVKPKASPWHELDESTAQLKLVQVVFR